MTDPLADYPEAHATKYVFSLLPDDDYERHSWAISVIWSPRYQAWYVCRGDYEGAGHYRMTRKGNWTMHRPSYATFPLDRALQLAHDQLPKQNVMGMTVEGLLAWRKQFDEKKEVSDE